jgi:pimeloyl-ACP methyl ester carboxylesterase
MKTFPTAGDWFAEGRRVPYDPTSKEMLPSDLSPLPRSAVSVFERVVTSRGGATDDARWTTLLPGFPDGSFGWARVDTLLNVTPRLYVEYVGQGDSDKPRGYPYGTMERADLVEAQWRAHGVHRTVLVTFDYSSLVMLELLQRQRERQDAGQPIQTRIEGVLAINGGLFADGHSHPWSTTPLLRTPFGRIGTQVAQRSRFVFDRMLAPLFSSAYGVDHRELGELYDAVTRRDGAVFMSEAAGFVDEHRRHAERWDLRDIFLASRPEVSFLIAGSEQDQFEPLQLVRARERLGEHGIDIRQLPGGHMSTSEQPEALAELIHEVAGHGEAAPLRAAS